MTGRGRPGLRVASLGALLLSGVLAGCATVVTGTASPAETSAPAPSESPSEPTPERTAEPVDVTPAPDDPAGRTLEAHRIAAFTALIPVSLPGRTEACFPSGPFVAAAAVEAAVFPPGTAADLLDRWGFVAGWAQCGAVPGGGPATTVLVLELSDPVSAERAMEEFTEAQAIDGFEPATVPGFEGGRTVLRIDAGNALAQVFVPVGRMLAYAFHAAPVGEGLEDLGSLMTDQVRLLEGFRPTPQADVPALPRDPQGLAGRVLDLPGEPTPRSGPYETDAYLRLAIDPIRERDLLAANGFSGFFLKEAEEGERSYAVALYTFPDSARTNVVYEAFAELEAAAYGGTRFTLPAVPAAPCFWSGGNGFFYQRCYVGYGQFLASVDVVGLGAPDDVALMNQFLPAQQDLIDG